MSISLNLLTFMPPQTVLPPAVVLSRTSGVAPRSSAASMWLVGRFVDKFPRAFIARQEWPGADQHVSLFMTKRENLALLSEQMKLRDAARTMIDQSVVGAPVVDRKHRVVGVLSRTDLLHQIAGKVKFIKRSRNPVKSERYMQNVELLQKKQNLLVGDVMTPNPITVLETTTMQEAAAKMASLKLNRLMVVDEEAGRLVGVISSTDVVKLALYSDGDDECDPDTFGI
jgi:CBS domain-containing protein